MTPEKIAEAMEVMAEAQREEPRLVEWREGTCRA